MSTISTADGSGPAARNRRSILPWRRAPSKGISKRRSTRGPHSGRLGTMVFATRGSMVAAKAADTLTMDGALLSRSLKNPINCRELYLRWIGNGAI